MKNTAGFIGVLALGFCSAVSAARERRAGGDRRRIDPPRNEELMGTG